MSSIVLALIFLLPQAAAPAPTTAVPAGFTIMAQLDSALSSRHARAGDTLHLTCLHDIAAESGKLYIPRGARLTAVVAAVQKYTSGNQSRLSLSLTHATWRGGDAALAGHITTLVSLGPHVIETVEPGSPSAEMHRPLPNVPVTLSGPMTMPSIDSNTTMPQPGSVSQPNSDTRTPSGTIKVRDRSAGERHLDDLGAPQSRQIAVPGRIPSNWGITRVDDAAIGSALIASGTDLTLPRGSQLIFTTR